MLDQARQVVERNRYTAFGETSVEVRPGARATGNRFGFQGHVYDPVTGFYQMRARYYAPAWGRFITADPIGALGGANLYAFAANRPADIWDPLGLTAQGNPSGDRASGRSPEPCVGDCAPRDGRDRLDTFDPRTDEQKINDILWEATRDHCDPSISTCTPARDHFADPDRSTELGNAVESAWTRMDEYDRKEAALWREADRVGVQSVPLEDLLPTVGVVRGVRVAGTAARGAGALPKLEISASKYPDLAENISHALKAGHPNVLTHGGNIKANRAAALEGVPNIPGLSRDEFPFASSLEGGAGAWVGHIPVTQQHAQGALVKNFIAAHGLKPGMQYQVTIGR